MSHRFDPDAVVEWLRRELDGPSRSRRLTLREIRDGAVGPHRLTLRRRKEIAHALSRAGLTTSVQLEEATLDQPLEVSDLSLPTRAASAPRQVQNPSRSPFSAVRRAFVIAVAVLGSTAAVLTIASHLSDDPPRRMTGDLNVLASRFDSPLEDGAAVAQSVERSLRSALRSGRGALAPEFQVAAQLELPPPGSTSGAAEAARRVNADIVVYGSIEHGSRGTLIRPHVYVDPLLLEDAEELGGSFALAPIAAGDIAAEDAMVARARLRAAVNRHVRGLAAFAVGLGWFDAGEWARASTWFARSQRFWRRGRASAMVSLFRGNAAGKLGRLASARTAYSHALRLDHRLLRARLGLAEVGLHEAQGGCDHRANARGLRSAARGFARIASRASAGGGLGDRALRLRARLGHGRALLCLSQAGIAKRWTAAVRSFDAVIREASIAPLRFRTETAEAHGGLGLISLPPNSARHEAKRAYRNARHHYALARELTDDPRRHDAFSRMIAFIDRRLR